MTRVEETIGLLRAQEQAQGQSLGAHAEQITLANSQIAEIQAHMRQTQWMAAALGVLLFAGLTTLVCAGWLLLLL